MENAKRAFFDGIATQWDQWHDLESLSQALATGLQKLEVARDETIVDLGSGTGNLTLALLAHLSQHGRVVAVDISEAMLAQAALKVRDDRVTWTNASAQAIPLPDETVDRVICFSAWPHFGNPDQVAMELNRILRPGGRVHVWHLASRAAINAIHAQAGEAVRADVLVEASKLATLFEHHGFVTDNAHEGAGDYLVTVRKDSVSR